MVHGISTRMTIPHSFHTNSKKTTPQTSVAVAETPAAPDWRALFTGKATIVTSDPPPTNTAPTAESVFGPNPWISNPTGMGPGGNVYSYNPYYFATPQTAAKVAQMVGGTVVQTYAFTPNGGPFAQMQPNQMVQLSNGRLINPGLVASFYTHGYSQSYIDQLVAAEVGNT
jgi:hypothetical protein